MIPRVESYSTQIASKKLPKTREIEEILFESIVGHEYFGAANRGFFRCLLFLTIMDISAYQTFFQLIIFLFI